MLRAHRLVALLLALGLALGATAAFVYAQAKKAETPPLGAPDFVHARHFSPHATDPRNRVARFSVRLRTPRPFVATVVGPGDVSVRRLPAGVRPRPGGGRTLRFRWDGRTDAGRPAPDGTYHLHVRLLGRHPRLFRLPNPIGLDATPPRVAARPPSGRVLGPAFGPVRLAFPARASEPAALRLTVSKVLPGGRLALRVRDRAPRALVRRRVLHWDGRVGGRPARPGLYAVGWEARDPAGNVTARPRAALVRVRGVELTPTLRVLTPAHRAVLRRVPAVAPEGPPLPPLAERAGPPARLHLPPPARAGLYGIEAVAGPYATWGTQAVPGRAPLLVLVPTYTWQANNPVGSELLPADAPRRLGRPLGPYGRGALDRLVAAVRPVIDRAPRWGAVTDAVVETAGVPAPARVLVVADEDVWTPSLSAAVARFTRRGGRVLLLGAAPRRGARRVRGALVLGGPRPVLPAGRARLHTVAAALGSAR